MLFSEASVVSTSDEASLHHWFSEYIRDLRVRGKLAVYGKSPMRLPSVNSLEIVTDYAQSVNGAKYLLSSAKLCKHAVESLGNKVFDALNSGSESVEFKYSGLSFTMSLDSMPREIIWISRDDVLSAFGDILVESEHEYRWTVVDPFKPSFDGSLAEAYALARKAEYRSRCYPQNLFDLDSTIRFSDSVPVGTVHSLGRTANVLRKPLPVSLSAVREARNELLAQRAREMDQDRIERIRSSQNNFESYWSTLKSNISKRVFPAEVTQSWDSIPLPESGTNSSRTWGIEVETVQAHLVSRPRGWEATGDGSLESMGDGYGCECSCGDCDDGYHNCGYSDCEDNNSCQEFVSPILSHFHSDGLKRLCGPLENAPVNDSPGIHVHVGADDLTITDVGRLVRAYSIVSPFIEHISYRNTRGYCKDISTSNVTYWLSAVRRAIKGDLMNYRTGERITPKDIVAASWHQPDDRYHDLNLQALGAHGTIEFRVMGPHYNYDHLVRWAWFCREMVNVSKLDLPVSVWTSVRSMGDVISVLRQYGSEIPSDSFDKETTVMANVMNGEFEFVEA